MSDLVALLSGRDFETREFRDEIAETSFKELHDAVLSVVNETNFKRYLMKNGITNRDELKKNLEMNCIPEGFENMSIEDYPRFLDARRKLMAKKIKAYYESLK